MTFSGALVVLLQPRAPHSSPHRFYFDPLCSGPRATWDNEGLSWQNCSAALPWPLRILHRVDSQVMRCLIMALMWSDHWMCLMARTTVRSLSSVVSTYLGAETLLFFVIKNVIKDQIGVWQPGWCRRDPRSRVSQYSTCPSFCKSFFRLYLYRTLLLRKHIS